MQKFDIIIVGNGIGAHVLLYELAKSQKFLDKKILHIYDSIIFPECSLNTTSVVSCDIHKKGISPLGDLLVDSLEDFQKTMTSFPNSYEKVHQDYLFVEDESQEKKDRFFERYGSDLIDKYDAKVVSNRAFLVYSKLLLNDLFHSFQQLDITTIKSSVSKVEKGSVSVFDKKYFSNKIILCTGAYTSFFKNSFDTFNGGKSVSGSYLIFKDVQFKESFVCSKGHYNLIYRKKYNELFFGGTSYEGHIHSHNTKELMENFDSFMSRVHLDFDRDNFEVRTGLRHKCSKRLPVANEVSEGIAVFSGFYKNGFTFPFHLAPRLINSFLLN